MRNPFMLAIAALFLSIFITTPALAQTTDRSVREVDCGPRYQVREAGAYVGCQSTGASAPGRSLDGVAGFAGITPVASEPSFTLSPRSVAIEEFARESSLFRNCLGTLQEGSYHLNRERLPESVMLMTEEGPELVSGMDAWVRFNDERAFVCLLIENTTGCERLIQMPDSRRASMYYARPSARALRGTAPELGAVREAGYAIDRDTLYELRRDRIRRCDSYLRNVDRTLVYPLNVDS